MSNLESHVHILFPRVDFVCVANDLISRCHDLVALAQ